jgi:hypothetical protein
MVRAARAFPALRVRSGHNGPAAKCFGANKLLLASLCRALVQLARAPGAIEKQLIKTVIRHVSYMVLHVGVRKKELFLLSSRGGQIRLGRIGELPRQVVDIKQQ